MKLPVEILFKIESYCDIYSRHLLLYLNKYIRSIILQKYYGYILYSETTSLVYDKYKMTIHKNKVSLEDYIKKNNKEICIKCKKVRFTNFGRDVAEQYNGTRIYDETAYIYNK
jgi:hypothetical protein